MKESRGKVLFYSGIIFVTALITRFFIWQDTRFEVWKVQTGIAEQYRLSAKLLMQDGFLSLFDPFARIANTDFLGHPPGYTLVLASLFSIFGESDVVVQTFSIGLDAFSAVLIFLIARKLLSVKVGIISGLLAAFSPSFALNSVFLLPDTLAVFPILSAIYFLIVFYEKQSLAALILSGISIGISCWLRSNSMLLPLFFGLAILLLSEGKIKYKFAGILIFASLLTVAPITVRNYIVYREFVPISLGGGQILLEGIGDYDKEQKFGIPNTDFGICQMEAQKYNRPDYARTLFGVDGIKRDRMRLSQGANFIRENPVWFGGVFVRRAFSLFNLEKAKIVSSQIPVTHSVSDIQTLEPVWEKSAAGISQTGTLISREALIANSQDVETIILHTDNTRFDAQFFLETDRLEKNKDYLFNALLHIKKGRVSIKVVGVDSASLYNSMIVEYDGYDELNGLTFETIEIPFVLNQSENLKILISNETAKPPESILEIKKMMIYNLGEASFIWTKPLRFIVRTIQKLFITAIIVPIALLGIIVLIKRKMWTTLLIVSIVPIYYVCLQSFLHTEFRYVLGLHYFVFILAAYFAAQCFETLSVKLKTYFTAKS